MQLQEIHSFSQKTKYFRHNQVLHVFFLQPIEQDRNKPTTIIIMNFFSITLLSYHVPYI